jgi:hypothetical protein
MFRNIGIRKNISNNFIKYKLNYFSKDIKGTQDLFTDSLRFEKVPNNLMTVYNSNLV